MEQIQDLMILELMEDKYKTDMPKNIMKQSKHISEH